jgi:predicted HicB family RNase H-like nuclease
MMYYVSMTQPMKVITIRVPPELHAAVMAAAREDRRSMTTYLQLLLEQHINLEASELHE